MGMKRIVASAGLLAMAAGVLIAPQAAATAPPPKLSVSPATLAPGQALTFTASCYGTPGPVKSAGLAESVELKGTSPGFTGQGRAAGSLGKFKASFYCTGGPNLPAASGTATVEFTVACPAPPPPSSTKPTETSTPGPSTPPSSSSSRPAPSSSSPAIVPAALTKPCGGTPPPTSPGKKQVKVTPKGAPQTGGGALAR
jgi:hypothetical protein